MVYNNFPITSNDIKHFLLIFPLDLFYLCRRAISFHRLTLLTLKLDFTLIGLKEIQLTNPFLLPLLHHLRQQGRIQVLAYLIGSKPRSGLGF